MTTKVYQGDIGTQIILDCGSDVTAATVREIIALKPDGTVVTWSAVPSGTTAISYVTILDDLNQVGKWKLQARVALPGGVWRGASADFIVYPPFA